MSARRSSFGASPEPEDDEDEGGHDGDHNARMDQKEMKFNYKQQKLHTDLEMWVMEAVPGLCGVADSDELREELQEDGQAELILKVIATPDTEAMRSLISNWIGDAGGDPGKKDDFIGKFVSMALKVQFAGKKSSGSRG
mmetsp:Transcript_144808/g.403483  ORF Transcript_144808/g.403483 Transcript_144808/m.403483 type:complete len:139 (+) Transcript_144808:97-513(+)